MHATLATLAQAAGHQAATTLTSTTGSHNDKGTTVPELTHEEEFLTHPTAAGVLGARLIGTLTGQSAPTAADVKALKAAGYTGQAPFDAHLRHELGEQRWAGYANDPARIVCAALITDGARAGYDMPALLSKVTDQRRWEDDERSRPGPSPASWPTGSPASWTNPLTAVAPVPHLTSQAAIRS